jgi:hypothetical protein
MESRKTNMKMKTTLPWQQRARGRARRVQLKEPLQDSAERRSLTRTKSSALLAISLGIFPVNVSTGRKSNPRSRLLLQLIWMHLQLDLKMNFHY